MKGYKGFDKDLKCLGFQYEVGKKYELDGEIVICERGFHFCKEFIDVIDFYDVKNGNRFCEIEATGEIVEDNENKKYCTNKIKIIKEIPIEEVLKKVNSGDRNSGSRNSGNCNSGNYNSGSRNSGNCNSGNYNSGSRNSGYYNSGYYNSGNCNSGSYNSGSRNSGNCNSGNYNSGYYNSGNYNSGYYNSGSRNSGDYNSGYYNSGSRNSGDYNSGYYNSGLFNTNEPNARLFNKVSDVKMSEIDILRIRDILSFIDKQDVKLVWKYTEGMTAKEKEKYPEHTITGGALMKVEIKVNVQEEWGKVSQEDKDFIKSLPNFDKDIFYECTGIKV